MYAEFEVIKFHFNFFFNRDKIKFRDSLIKILLLLHYKSK